MTFQELEETYHTMILYQQQLANLGVYKRADRLPGDINREDAIRQTETMLEVSKGWLEANGIEIPEEDEDDG